MVVFVNDQPWAERRIDFAVFFVLWHIVGKYALICAMEIQKIQMVVHIFSVFALFTEVMRVYRRVKSLQVVDHKQCEECAFGLKNKRVQIKILSNLKLV